MLPATEIHSDQYMKVTGCSDMGVTIQEERRSQSEGRSGMVSSVIFHTISLNAKTEGKKEVLFIQL